MIIFRSSQLKSEEMSSATASPSGGKSRIDLMSHEDLQQFAKKQMTMLKNLKNKTDVVTKERDSMKTELSKTKEEHEPGFQIINSHWPKNLTNQTRLPLRFGYTL